MTTRVLDTSVLISNPLCYKQFDGDTILIPIPVLNELDKLKKGSGDVSRNARIVIRWLDELSNLGDLSVGVSVGESLIKIDTVNRTIDVDYGDPYYGDTKILACLFDIHTYDNDVVLMSNDINLRVKAKARGIRAEKCEDKIYNLTGLYSGVVNIVDPEKGTKVIEKGYISCSELDIELQPNQCIIFQDKEDNIIAMGRKIKDRIRVVKKLCPWNIISRNEEQAFAIDMMMDKKIDLLTMIGKAGTGKSIVVYAAALELVLNKREYERLIIYRPIQPVGADIGFIPGEKEAKLAPWFQGVMDSMEVLFSNRTNNSWRKELDMYVNKNRIEMEAITYIRGRSIPNSIIVLDEAQNMNKEEIKTILTRVGENTKIVLLGDIEQIDNEKLDATNNGLTYVIEKFRGSELAGHISLLHGERSRLASLAADIL